MRHFALLALLLAIVTGCATTVSRPVQGPNIYVMRHLHTPEGERNPDLTAEGQAAAVRLAALMADDPPAVIFVSDTKRAKQTAAPVAAKFGVAPTVYDPLNSSGLVARLLAEKGTVLIVGHSNTVPDIVAGLGGERPAALVHSDFGDLWHIQGPHRTTTRLRI